MSEKIPTLAEMTGIQLEGLPNSMEIGQKLWRNRNRIKDAYLRDQRYDSIGKKSLAYCPWSVCLMDETKTHTHLHRAGTCEWNFCNRTQVHIHKFTPLPVWTDDVDPTGRYERVKDIMKEILGEQYQEEPLAKNMYLKLEDERKAEEAAKEREATRLADAERAGDEAKRNFERATAERRAQRANENKKAREFDQALERRRLERRAAKAQLVLEAETGNELERTFSYPKVSSKPSLITADVQPQVSHPPSPQNQLAENDNPVVEADAILGKRKRAKSPRGSSSPSPSPAKSKAAKANKLTGEEDPSNTESPSTKSPALEADSVSDSETSDLTLYTPYQLDTILDGGAEIVRHDPKSLPIRTLEVAEPQNRNLLGLMLPPPPPPRQKKLSKEDIEMEEQLARRRQIQWVLQDPKYKKTQREKWGAIKIYED